MWVSLLAKRDFHLYFALPFYYEIKSYRRLGWIQFSWTCLDWARDNSGFHRLNLWPTNWLLSRELNISVLIRDILSSFNRCKYQIPDLAGLAYQRRCKQTNSPAHSSWYNSSGLTFPFHHWIVSDFPATFFNFFLLSSSVFIFSWYKHNSSPMKTFKWAHFFGVAIDVNICL